MCIYISLTLSPRQLSFAHTINECKKLMTQEPLPFPRHLHHEKLSSNDYKQHGIIKLYHEDINN